MGPDTSILDEHHERTKNLPPPPTLIQLITDSNDYQLELLAIKNSLTPEFMNSADWDQLGAEKLEAETRVDFYQNNYDKLITKRLTVL